MKDEQDVKGYSHVCLSVCALPCQSSYFFFVFGPSLVQENDVLLYRKNETHLQFFLKCSVHLKCYYLGVSSSLLFYDVPPMIIVDTNDDDDTRSSGTFKYPTTTTTTF